MKTTSAVAVISQLVRNPAHDQVDVPRPVVITTQRPRARPNVLNSSTQARRHGADGGVSRRTTHPNRSIRSRRATVVPGQGSNTLTCRATGGPSRPAVVLVSLNLVDYPLFNNRSQGEHLFPRLARRGHSRTVATQTRWSAGPIRGPGVTAAAATQRRTETTAFDIAQHGRSRFGASGRPPGWRPSGKLTSVGGKIHPAHVWVGHRRGGPAAASTIRHGLTSSWR